VSDTELHRYRKVTEPGRTAIRTPAEGVSLSTLSVAGPQVSELVI